MVVTCYRHGNPIYKRSTYEKVEILAIPYDLVVYSFKWKVRIQTNKCTKLDYVLVYQKSYRSNLGSIDFFDKYFAVMKEEQVKYCETAY